MEEARRGCFAVLTLALPHQSTALAPVTTNNGGGTGLHCSADKLKSGVGRIGGRAGGQCFVAALRAGRSALLLTTNVSPMSAPSSIPTSPPLCYLDVERVGNINIYLHFGCFYFG